MDFGTDFAPPVQLSRKRKAALIVQMLLKEGGAIPLTSLPERLQEELAVEMGAIRLVDRETVNSVAEEFIGLLSAIGLSAPGDHSKALDALGDLISPDLLDKLRRRFGGPLTGDQWPRIIEMEVEELIPIMQAESIEVSAIVLSKLPVARAAAVLAALPGPQARQITFAVSQTADIGAEAVARIGTALVTEYCQKKSVAFDKPPTDRIGAILNSSPAATREDLLEGLESEDELIAKGVRKAIFTFPDIPDRVKDTDVPNIIRAVDGDVFNRAMAAALSGNEGLTKAAEFILSNISQRMAGQIREDAAEMGKIKASEAEEAMNLVTSVIRDQADAGTIVLIDPDEAEEEDEAA